MGSHRLRYLLSYRLVCHAQMATKLCFQNGIKLVGVCHGGNGSRDSSNNNGKLAELEGGNAEPGGEFEV